MWVKCDSRLCLCLLVMDCSITLEVKSVAIYKPDNSTLWFLFENYMPDLDLLFSK